MAGVNLRGENRESHFRAVKPKDCSSRPYRESARYNGGSILLLYECRVFSELGGTTDFIFALSY